MQFGMPTLAVLIALALFGIAYNATLAWLERRGYHEGYTALLVAFGTTVTLIGFGTLAGWQAALLALVCFAASGTPMIIGSIARYVRARARELQDIRQTIAETLSRSNLL